MRKFLIKIGLIFLLSFVTEPARSEIVFGLLEGYSQGVLTRKTVEKFTTFSTLATLGYKIGKFDVHGFFQSMDLDYGSGDSSYKGVYATTGIGVGYKLLPSQIGVISFAVQRPLSATYIILSQTTANVKGVAYQHSELTSLQGGSAWQIIAGYDFLIYGRGTTRKGENFSLGAHLGYLNQDFKIQSTRIKTNNSELAPVSSGSEKVNYSLSILSLYFCINYDI